MNALYIPVMAKVYQGMLWEAMLYPFCWWMYLPGVRQEKSKRVSEDE
jgi:hypothetical protein